MDVGGGPCRVQRANFGEASPGGAGRWSRARRVANSARSSARLAAGFAERIKSAAAAPRPVTVDSLTARTHPSHPERLARRGTPASIGPPLEATFEPEAGEYWLAVGRWGC
jgi:hypothetical protein